jgi:hypothetical protein
MPRRAQEPQRCPWRHVTLDAVAGSALTIVGVALLATAERGSYLSIPGLTLVSALYGKSVADDCERHNERLETERLARAASTERRERAWAITRTAAEAARAGDCGRVFALDIEAHEVDAEFHAAVFVRDVAIAGCIAGGAP